MKVEIITIFPDYFESPLKFGLFRIACGKGLASICARDLRDYSDDPHRQVDDTPYGGGPGMVMKPEPFFKAVRELRKGSGFKDAETEVIMLSPRGEAFDQEVALELARKKHLIMICGRYEGIDERVRENLATREISCGNYILAGGEPAALVLMEAILRLIPGVLGEENSLEFESFERGLLEYPQYTRPEKYEGHEVPKILTSGDHAAIYKWRLRKAVEETEKRTGRKFDTAGLTAEERKLLENGVS